PRRARRLWTGSARSAAARTPTTSTSWSASCRDGPRSSRTWWPPSSAPMSPDRSALVGDAEAAAESAARACRVRLRELSELAALQRVYELYQAIWRPDPANPPITTALGHAL